uniref:Peptidase C14 caspase domain-containing protein n=1 Tax=Leersia perrieri TaxID=77586 RepID=A0A0D9VUS0_9ORYZ
MNFGGRFRGGGGGTVRCRYCSASLPVMPGASAIQCAQCNGVTRVRRRHGGGAVGPCRPVAALPMPVAPMGGGGFFPQVRSKKRAVLIGITYAGMRRGGGTLRGPVNDVKCMRYLLCEWFAFPNDSVLILTDEEKDPSRLATKENIRMAMHWLVQGCSYGDSLVFHFSGLGAQVADDDGDEVDGYDEAICPMDSFLQGPILDDEINEAIVRPLVHGAKLHAVVDAEHSSTLPEASTVGAMTHSFIKAVECEPRATYGRLLTSMRAIMREGGVNCNLQLGPVGSPIRKVANFSGVQEPNMSCSEMFDIYRKPFVL